VARVQASQRVSLEYISTGNYKHESTRFQRETK
jgi:hypothetical protein